MKVLGGVFVHRSVTTAYVAATKAQPEVHPCIPRLQALLTAWTARSYGSNLIQVRALRLHAVSSQQLTYHSPLVQGCAKRVVFSRVLPSGGGHLKPMSRRPAF